MSHFKTAELVPKEVYALLGENARNLINPAVIAEADKLREWGGEALTVNTPDGKFDASGLRTHKSSHYSPRSQHSGNNGGSNQCNALDLKPKSGDVKKYHLEILENPSKYPNINFIEIDVGWLHIDSRPRATHEVQLWSPSRGFVKMRVYMQELRGEK